MPLQPVKITEDSRAEALAQRLVQEIVSTAERVNKIRTEGLPAMPAQEEKVLPDGRVIPARDEQPAISADAIKAKLGVANNALLDQLKAALGI